MLRYRLTNDAKLGNRTDNSLGLVAGGLVDARLSACAKHSTVVGKRPSHPEFDGSRPGESITRPAGICSQEVQREQMSGSATSTSARTAGDPTAAIWARLVINKALSS